MRKEFIKAMVAILYIIGWIILIAGLLYVGYLYMNWRVEAIIGKDANFADTWYYYWLYSL